MKLVAYWTTSNGFTTSNDYVQPFEYESEEAFMVDFENVIRKNFAECKYDIVFAGVQWDISHFFYHYGQELVTDLPEVLPLEKWFETYHRN